MFGLFEGPSGGEKQNYNLLNSSSQFATGLGEGNLSISSDFFRNLLVDPTKALAPEIKAGQDQVQQAAKTNAEFGNRGGGTNASTQAASANNRANLINAAVNAQTGAASNLASTGSGLLSTGMSGTEAGFDEAKTMQDQRAAMWNDIIKSSAAVAAAPFTGGSSLGFGPLSLPGSGGGIDPSTFTNLMQEGTVNPAQLDPSLLSSSSAIPM